MKVKSTARNGLRSFSAWLQEVGVSAVTGWRWRQNGWLKVHNINGRAYIDESEIDRFNAKVRRGQFSMRPIVPKPGASKPTRDAARLNHGAGPVAAVAVEGGQT
jgi:hypothetical protein